MQFIIVLFAVATLAFAKNVNYLQLEEHTAHGYHTKVGIPEAERIRQIEETYESSRIAGGVPASISQYPFKAGIIGDLVGLTGVSVCGGSLVSTSRVVTAAHCWNDGTHQAWRFTIVLGSDLLFFGGTRVTTSAVVMHPNWSSLLVRNDIAVAYLASSVETSANISPIALPTGGELFDDFASDVANAIGFGATGDNNPISNSQSLSHVRLNVITNSVCSLVFPLTVQNSNICTSGIGGVGLCSGDSGGPLVVTRNNEPILIGVFSFRSATGCQANLPSVFTRTTSYVDFIRQHM